MLAGLLKAVGLDVTTESTTAGTLSKSRRETIPDFRSCNAETAGAKPSADKRAGEQISDKQAPLSCVINEADDVSRRTYQCPVDAAGDLARLASKIKRSKQRPETSAPLSDHRLSKGCLLYTSPSPRDS